MGSNRTPDIELTYQEETRYVKECCRLEKLAAQVRMRDRCKMIVSDCATTSPVKQKLIRAINLIEPDHD